MKISAFYFCKGPKGRFIHVKLTGGASWIIEESRTEEEGFPFHLVGFSDREAKPAERSILQAVADALGRYLTGEAAGGCLSYGEIVAVEYLADLVQWGTHHPRPTEEEGRPGLVLQDFVENFVNFS